MCILTCISSWIWFNLFCNVLVCMDTRRIRQYVYENEMKVDNNLYILFYFDGISRCDGIQSRCHSLVRNKECTRIRHFPSQRHNCIIAWPISAHWLLLMLMMLQCLANYCHYCHRGPSDTYSPLTAQSRRKLFHHRRRYVCTPTMTVTLASMESLWKCRFVLATHKSQFSWCIYTARWSSMHFIQEIIDQCTTMCAKTITRIICNLFVKN